ncbi:amino acid-binding protein [Methanococcoides methylutens]|uniref:ACT-domain-containing protein, predicted allosteric regulator of homoserine dehydrogenase n=1 Tax=Methanococcoides methylutens MM1 TaxID=1434104 RepID=A0A0E3SSQ4_METMT|nr:amino acid-binding protein [Methanococcoides methylutens]AKB85643.1 ACT-domain-containing protein, predicted allosteric regulator of homoserine dehydrogenase [Methanococcoides methylutens MM1]
MRVSMDIELKDAPGQLLLALNPISELKGNLKSIVHHHEERTPRSTIPVQVVFEVEPENLDLIISRLEENGIGVARVDEKRFMEHGAVILIGHIVHTDIQDTIDTIDKTGFAEVVDICLSMPHIDTQSSASLKIDAIGRKELHEAMSVLREVAHKKDLLVVEPIEADFA